MTLSMYQASVPVFTRMLENLSAILAKAAAHAEAKLGIALGYTTADDRVTLEPIYCLGLCATAPSAMLDGRVVGRLDEKRLDALLAEAQR